MAGQLVQTNTPFLRPPFLSDSSEPFLFGEFSLTEGARLIFHKVPAGSPSLGGVVAVRVCCLHQPSLPTPLNTAFGVEIFLYGPFN